MEVNIPSKNVHLSVKKQLLTFANNELGTVLNYMFAFSCLIVLQHTCKDLWCSSLDREEKGGLKALASQYGASLVLCS